MDIKVKFAIFLFIVTDAILVGYLFLRNKTIAVFEPAGTVALQERNVFVFAILLGLSVVVPIVLFTFFIAWKYRADNQTAKYAPDWDQSWGIEIFRWGLLCGVIGILAVVTFIVAHTLDPYKPLASNIKPVNIQVVALQWRWLFIYPEQHIATIDYIAIPEKTPVNLELTADAPMNSIWIPQLVGQIYAMAGMSTKTHLMVNTPGKFQGSDAEISGKGFAGMKFFVQSMNGEDFNSWVAKVKQSPKKLTRAEYEKLAKPSTNTGVSYYVLQDDNLYNEIMMKFMGPPGSRGMQM